MYRLISILGLPTYMWIMDLADSAEETFMTQQREKRTAAMLCEVQRVRWSTLDILAIYGVHLYPQLSWPGLANGFMVVTDK